MSVSKPFLLGLVVSFVALLGNPGCVKRSFDMTTAMLERSPAGRLVVVTRASPAFGLSTWTLVGVAWKGCRPRSEELRECFLLEQWCVDSQGWINAHG